MTGARIRAEEVSCVEPAKWLDHQHLRDLCASVVKFLLRLSAWSAAMSMFEALLHPNYRVMLQHDFHSFLHRSFGELNPRTPFLDNWHIEVLAAKLDDVRKGKTRRLIVNLPPRHLKSHAASIAFVAFWLGHDPSAQILCVSYGQ